MGGKEDVCRKVGGGGMVDTRTYTHARTPTSQASAHRTSGRTTGVVEAREEDGGGEGGCREGGGKQGTANSHAQRTGMAGVARRRAGA